METPNIITKKRSRNADDEDSYSPTVKARKLLEQGSVGSGLGTESDSGDSSYFIKESLQHCLQNLFKTFQAEVSTDELSTKVYFIFQFFSLLVQCGKTDRIKHILKLIPNGLIQNLLKIIPIDELSVGFILR
jgi:mediator of RNA polymerase II transcription subunit 24